LTELGDKARSLVEAGRALDDPTPADRARVRARLAATLGGSAALGAATASKASAAAAKSGSLWSASAAFGSKLLSPLVIAVALSGATAAVIWTRADLNHPSQASRQSTARRLQMPPTPRSASVQPVLTVQPSAALPADSVSQGDTAAAESNAAPAAVSLAVRPALELRANQPSTARTTSARQNRAPGPARRTSAANATTAMIRTPDEPSEPTEPLAPRAPVSAPEPVPATLMAPPPAHDAEPPADARIGVAVGSLPRPAAGREAWVTSTHTETLPRTTSVQAPDLADELALLSAAQRAIRTRDYTQALALLDEHAARHATGSLTPERLAARAVALCRLQRVPAGLSELQRLETRAPQSPLLPWARTNCLPVRSP
jgi:hypothetical protein